MEKVAIDTNIAIAILNGSENTVNYLRSFHQIFIPVTVSGELLFGAHNSKNTKANLINFRKFIATCHPLSVTNDVAETYASIRMALKRQGTPIPENDIWIAAICIENKLPLVTNDKHFHHIQTLITLSPE